jgi:hypothetical protein
MDLTILVFPTPGGPWRRSTLAKNRIKFTFEFAFEFGDSHEF